MGTGFREYCSLTREMKEIAGEATAEVASLRGEIQTTRHALLQWMDSQGFDRVVLPGETGVLKRRLHTNRQSITPAILAESWARAYSSHQLQAMVEHEGFSPRDAVLVCFLRCFDEAGSKFTPYADVVEPGSKADGERHSADPEAPPPREPSLTTGVPPMVVELAENLVLRKEELRRLEEGRKEACAPLRTRLREMEEEVKRSLGAMPEKKVKLNLERGEEDVVLSVKSSKAKPPIGIKVFKQELAPSIVASLVTGGGFPDISPEEAERVMERVVGEYLAARMEERPPELRMTRSLAKRRRKGTPE